MFDVGDRETIRRPTFFYIFYVFFSKSKKHDFLRFFWVVAHVFSNTGSDNEWRSKLRRVELLMTFHLTATECRLRYGITQCYLPPDTSEHTPPWTQPDRPVLD